MQILGDLIILPKTDQIPLPWWHRVPLGLLSNTSVFISLTETRARPIGDLVVSLLDPDHWDQIVRLVCRPQEGPGVLARKFSVVQSANIALAEAVTVDSGTVHEVSLFCEPSDFREDRDLLTRIKERIAQEGFSDVVDAKPYQPCSPVVWHDVATVTDGWVEVKNWREALRERMTEESFTLMDSLSKAVVSADTDQRILRFVFPMKGAKSLRVQHADKPGALVEITNALQTAGANILSALLRRGGVNTNGNAMLIAVCEPNSPEKVEGFETEIRKALRGIHTRYRIKERILPGEEGSKTIYCQHKHDIVARPPEELVHRVQTEKRKMPKGKMPVFFSRRFYNCPRTAPVEARIRAALEKNDCFPVEAPPRPGGFSTVMDEVSARLWSSRAGVVLVMGSSDVRDPDKVLSVNLAHEFGFLQGQGKPVLVLVEEHYQQALKDWSIAQGLMIASFNPQSLETLDLHLNAWANTLKQN